MIPRTNDLGRTLVVMLVLSATACSSSPRPSPLESTITQPAERTSHAGDAGDPDAIAAGMIGTPTPSSLVLNIHDWTFGGYDGVIVETANYRLHTTLEPGRFRDQLPVFFENALERYANELAPLPRPSEPMDTYLFADNRQWQAKTRQLLPQQASQFSNLGSGGYTTRGIAVLYYLDRNDTFAIAAHEGWHQYTQSTFRDPLPIWLEEGIATYMEVIRNNPDGSSRFAPSRNYERWYALRTSVRRDRLIPLEELLVKTPQTYLEESKARLLAYYAQVWALTCFLLEGEDGRYAPALTEALQAAAEGRLLARMRRVSPRSGVTMTRNGPLLLETYFTDDLASFEEAYVAYLRRLVATPQQSASSGTAP